jgi:predicted HTH transcriptional regulator
MISRGESHEVEFKSSLRWDYREERNNPILQWVVARSVAGFLNAKGGTLLVGVDNDGTVVGIERDFATLSHPNRDWWELSLTEALVEFLGSDAAAIVATDYEVLDGNTVAIVRCPRRARPTWLRQGDDQKFVTRIGNSTRPLLAPFSDIYIDEHFG